MLDFHDLASRILTAATSGISATRISDLGSGIKRDDLKRILQLLVNKKLVEVGESSVYWTTKEGLMFLEIRFNMERMLKAQTSLV